MGSNVTERMRAKALRKVLARPAPSVIPRSGERGEQADCFATRLFVGDDVMIVDSFADGQLNCRAWESDGFTRPVTVSFADAQGCKLEVTHFYGLATVVYNGWNDLAWGLVTRQAYISIAAQRIRNHIFQGIYNRKKLVSKQRVDILKAVLSVQLDGQESVSSSVVMTALYGERWFFHPEQESRFLQVRIYLKSLIATKELEQKDFGYSITGQGIAAIEVYEEQERKHAQSLGTQKRMVWLTVLLAAVAIVQAGLVKFSPVLDFTKQQKQRPAPVHQPPNNSSKPTPLRGAA